MRGLWKIIDISRPRRSRISFSGASRTSRPEKVIDAVGDLAGAIEDAHHRIGRDRLSGAGFADDADGFALGHRDIDMLHRLHDAAPGHEFDREVLHVEQGAVVIGSVLKCGAADRRCRAIRRPAG